MIVIGYNATLAMAEGGRIRGAHGAAILHDPSGKHWGKCSVLIAPFSHSGEDVSLKGKSVSQAQKFYGGSYDLKQGSVKLPSRPLEGWKNEGPVRQIFYTRKGERSGPWEHPFGGSTSGMTRWLFSGATGYSFNDEYPILYRKGTALRLELGKGCILDHRGFVSP